MNLSVRNFFSELIFKASRSSGKGGQHVNKVSTKIELCFDVVHSLLLSEKEKAIIFRKLSHRINEHGILKITSQSERSQLQNKRIAIEKFFQLLEKSLTPPKKRIASNPTRQSKAKRLKEKKIHSEKKQARKKKLDWE